MKIKKGEELLLVKKGEKLFIEKSPTVYKKFVGEFNFMARHADAVVKKLWNNKEDEIWNKL